MNIDNLICGKGTTVTLNIESSRPIKTLNGDLHEAGQLYKVLGTHGTCLRLSRASDCAKLIIDPARVTVVTLGTGAWPQPRRKQLTGIGGILGGN